MRKYRRTLTRSLILLFLVSGNLSAWASSVSKFITSDETQHCEQHAHAQHQQAVDHQNDEKLNHDCCKTTKPCNKLCCNLCLVSAMPGLALFAFMDIQFDYQSAKYSPLSITLPVGAMSSTPYRPPQSLLI